MNRQLKRVSSVIAAVAFVAVPIACGDDDDEGTGPNPGAEGDTTIVMLIGGPDYAFEPAQVTISPGEVIRWVDAEDDSDDHTVTPDGHGEWQEAEMEDGDVFTHTFDATGTFDYYCDPHRTQGMTGSITVEE